MTNYPEIIRQAYTAFNLRDIDTVLSLLDPSVRWSNGWEGGYVNGHDEVRRYWLRQWQELNPTVTPVSFHEKPDGRIEVDVHQVVNDVRGNLLVDGFVKHIYTVDDGKINRMDIEKP